MENSLCRLDADQLLWMLIDHGHNIIGTAAEMLEWIEELKLPLDNDFLRDLRGLHKGTSVSFIGSYMETFEGILDKIDFHKKTVEVIYWDKVSGTPDIVDLDPNEVWDN